MLVACAKSRAPKNLITADHFVQVMVDVHLAEASVSNMRIGPDSARTLLAEHYATILSDHRITGVQLNESFGYYKRHPEEMARIYERVIEELSALEVTWSNKYE